MKRGVIQLTKAEAYEVLKLFLQSQQQSSLYTRLESAQNSDSDIIDLHVSEEELEVLLDNVGIPESDEPIERGNLRKKVREYLNTLREGV